jgi:spermidine synthase
MNRGNYKLQIALFVGGAIIMVLELLGSRILAPYVGTSIIVWTSLIGIIMGSLSLGYFYGGKLADKKPSYKSFSLIVFFAGIAVFSIAFLKTPVLFIIEKFISDLKLATVLGTTVLFAPASTILGAIHPYAVKLEMKKPQQLGSTVGKLSAISTIGSIAGTFLAGFVLIAYFENTTILFLLAATLNLLSIYIDTKNSRSVKLTLLLIILAFLTKIFPTFFNDQSLASVDSQYNHIEVIEKPFRKHKNVRHMIINGTYSSAIDLDTLEIVYPYIQYYGVLSEHFKPHISQALMIGGAGFVFPSDFLKKNPSAQIDVVEIDPKVTELAEKYFFLDKNNPRISIYHEDGRIFLNKNSKKYDAIFIDAHNIYSIPYHLATKEAVFAVYNTLTEDGIVITNVVSPTDSQFLRAEYATYKEIFPQVYLFPTLEEEKSETLQNIMLVAFKQDIIPNFESEDQETQEYLNHLWRKEINGNIPILTDEFAPVDHYMIQLLNKQKTLVK